MNEKTVEPEITEGIKKATWYEYGASNIELLQAALQWVKDHPDVEIMDIMFGSDEGTWLTIYFQDREKS